MCGFICLLIFPSVYLQSNEQICMTLAQEAFLGPRNSSNFVDDLFFTDLCLGPWNSPLRFGEIRFKIRISIRSASPQNVMDCSMARDTNQRLKTSTATVIVYQSLWRWKFSVSD